MTLLSSFWCKVKTGPTEQSTLLKVLLHNFSVGTVELTMSTLFLCLIATISHCRANFASDSMSFCQELEYKSGEGSSMTYSGPLGSFFSFSPLMICFFRRFKSSSCKILKHMAVNARPVKMYAEHIQTVSGWTVLRKIKKSERLIVLKVMKQKKQQSKNGHDSSLIRMEAPMRM